MCTPFEFVKAAVVAKAARDDALTPSFVFTADPLCQRCPPAVRMLHNAPIVCAVATLAAAAGSHSLMMLATQAAGVLACRSRLSPKLFNKFAEFSLAFALRISRSGAFVFVFEIGRSTMWRMRCVRL